MTESGNVVTIKFDGDHMTAYVKGDIDHHLAKKIRDEINEQFYIKRPKKLTLDLSGVEFMDSSGLGLILGRYNATNELGSEFNITGAGEQVMRIIKLAGLDRIIKTEVKKS
jgi:stage II sporulation protein AA (anti-sigma F factor antagonist)